MLWFVAFFAGATTRLFSTSHQRKDSQGGQRQQGNPLTDCSCCCKVKWNLMATWTWRDYVQSWKPKSSLDIKCVEFTAVKIRVEHWWYSGTSINGHSSTMATRHFFGGKPIYCLNLSTTVTFYCPQGDHWGVVQLWFLKSFTPWPRCGTKNCMES